MNVMLYLFRYLLKVVERFQAELIWAISWVIKPVHMAHHITNSKHNA